MAAGLFTIHELLPSGLTGAAFYWTADETAAVPTDDALSTARGGAQACPLGDWNQPGEMRSVRTDYTGNPVPSEQVQGSKSNPQEFNGRWDDRYNYKGYAQDTLKAFRALCERGNLVEISFQGKGYRGLLKTWNFPERRHWDVRYSFSLSIHGTFEQVQAADFGLEDRIERSPIEHRDDVDDIIAALALVDEVAPRSHMVDGPADAASETLATIEAALDSLDDSLDQRDLNVSSPSNPISPFSLLAAKFRTLINGALDINQGLLEVKSDVSLAVVTGKAVLDFEDWTRSMRFHARILMGQSLDAEQDMKARDQPEVDRLYRAREGESLMAISRQVYGTPHQWHTIAEANSLETEVLTGEEILIIPELGAV